MDNLIKEALQKTYNEMLKLHPEQKDILDKMLAARMEAYKNV